MYIDEGSKGKIIINNPHISLKIKKSQGSKLILNGDVFINSHIGGTNPIIITLGVNSTLKIDGDFIIGNGVKLILSDEAFLYLGGKDIESGSGITADSVIMCYKDIRIGKDFLCAWNVFITDSDWHTIENKQHYENVTIGNHVWIANNSSVLKGSTICDNSIVASLTKISNKSYPPNSMLAGIPANIVKSNISWSRDI
ncbi:putative lipopolysaccharide biosynthesis O-acetyl transferase WbbJ [Flavobacterium sp. ACN2]|jgi:acetyltransferase-like isoleucine patch superfamily enzyme|uniref:acyltransferase n=1 Tax=unclassified Flavobacterium TaxID=196869 RepID=UPI000BB32BE1|nr:MULTISPECIES: hypothetical protein [unclassified Flavobacterium]MDY0987391.1 hypothetical protein [Flavobacterium sp. CFBP9031]PBI84158.1 putative lipopolysaccharide biosynthesis O-acetyl transferase WbbJ [Flavobacterium sp. ACN2]